ncbi:deoxyribonuclease V [Alkalilimnicola sp. S0819]|uniref:deoxyribonuclease V n=1 Tax=Alkalilimnicola sp. S0819 TaxID=2613922 RepID=UPI001D01B16B|nr:deoxyribonuclease V [Alkalilimnicola sp. S0819]
MKLQAPHRWDVSPAEAVAIQRELRTQLRLEPLRHTPRLIAGVDAGFEDAGRTARAAVVLYQYPELEPVEEQLAREPVRMPYIPGLLSFREIPVVLKALAQLHQEPELLLCDGQGIAHPRRLGIAAHLGLITDLPAIGVGKSRLIGDFQEPGTNRGEQSPLKDKGERIGTVLRTRDRVKPVFVSPGHRMDQRGAVDWVMRCLTRYRLPEPIRAADRLASAWRRKPSP